MSDYQDAAECCPEAAWPAAPTCPASPGPKPAIAQHPGRDLLEFSRNHQHDVLRFGCDTRIWPTKNISERGVRPLKTQPKISGRPMPGNISVCTALVAADRLTGWRVMAVVAAEIISSSVDYHVFWFARRASGLCGVFERTATCSKGLLFGASAAALR